jgi:hypothetical protein
MESRNSWGIVYVAATFAVIIVGGALAVRWFEGGHAAPATTAGNPASGQMTAATSEPAPGLSQTLSQDLYTGYANLAQQGTPTAAQQQQLVASVVAKDIQPQNVVPNLTVGQLNIVATTSMQNYISLVAIALNESSQIKQDESYVFANTVENNATTGTPVLVADAQLYQRIAAALLVMPVPPAVASQHLELVKSVAALGNVVRNMGEWKGDPAEALSDVDTFNKARNYAENSANALTVAVQKLEAQQKS